MKPKLITKSESWEDLRHILQLTLKYQAMIRDKTKDLLAEVDEAIIEQKKKKDVK